MSRDDKAAFTPEDIRILRLLVVSLGVIACGLFWLVPDNPWIVIGLIGGMLAASIGVIYLLRYLRTRH